MNNELFKPGLYHNISAALYHADPCPSPSLSSGILRTLIKERPAHAKLECRRLGGRPRNASADMILGSYIHGLAAGDVTEFDVGEFDNFTTKAAREWRDAAEAIGKTPILKPDADRAGQIAEALMAKAGNGLTTNPFVDGKPEVTAIWQEDDVWCRARYDRLITDEDGFADVWDWKTTGAGVSDDALLRTIVAHGYHIQAAWYLRGLIALLPEYRGRASFIFCFVETAEPFSVRRVCLDPAWLHFAEGKINRAVKAWRECLAVNDWPTYQPDTLTLEMPAWLDRDNEGAEITASLL